MPYDALPVLDPTGIIWPLPVADVARVYFSGRRWRKFHVAGRLSMNRTETALLCTRDPVVYKDQGYVTRANSIYIRSDTIRKYSSIPPSATP